AEHALPEHDVRTAGAAAAVEALLRPVVDARDALRGQLHGQHVEGQVADTAVAAEAPLAAPLAHLFVVVHQSDHLVAVPAVPGRLLKDPVAEEGEIIRGVGVARDHPLQLAGDVLDPQGGVQAGLLHHFPGVLAAAAYLPDQEEALLAEALGEL